MSEAPKGVADAFEELNRAMREAASAIADGLGVSPEKRTWLYRLDDWLAAHQGAVTLAAAFFAFFACVVGFLVGLAL